MTGAQPAGRPGSRRPEVVAGITVTAYLIPQVMAYSGLAGLPPSAGLWAAVVALGVYFLLGSSPQLSVGPESTTALMTGAAVATLVAPGQPPEDVAAALALAVGALCLLGFVGGLGFLADLLSRSVLTGYMAGVAALMILSQAARATGTDIPVEGVLAEPAWVLQHPGEIHLATLVVFAATLVALLAGAHWWLRGPVPLLGMVGAAAAVALLGLEQQGVDVVGEIPASLPDAYVPSLETLSTAALLTPALAVALVAFTDNILTARAFAARRGDRIDARRELLALGAGNIAAGLVHGFPVSSSGSRTAIVDASGGRTRLTGLATMLATLLALLALRPVLEAFPQAALAAVVVWAATRLVDIPELLRIGRFRRSELLIALTTTVSVVALGVLEGVLVAVGLSVLDLLRRVARPHDAVQGFVPGVAGMHDVDDYPAASVLPGLVVYRYDSPLFFANAEDFLARARAAVDGAAAPVRWMVLNTEAISEIDFTGAEALRSLHAELTARGITLAMARAKQDFLDNLAPTGLAELVGTDRIFPTLPTAVEAFRAAEEPTEGV